MVMGKESSSRRTNAENADPYTAGTVAGLLANAKFFNQRGPHGS